MFDNEKTYVLQPTWSLRPIDFEAILLRATNKLLTESWLEVSDVVCPRSKMDEKEDWPKLAVGYNCTLPLFVFFPE